MKTLQERSRRTVRRNLEKGKISWDTELGYFVDEQGNKVTALHFRKGFTLDGDEGSKGDEDLGSDYDDEDFDEEELEEEENEEEQGENHK